MAWASKTPHAICEQLKDPARNGGKTLAEVATHTAEDGLVAWAWAPGHGRSTPPGDQASFAALIAAWVVGAVTNTGGRLPPVAPTVMVKRCTAEPPCPSSTGSNCSTTWYLHERHPPSPPLSSLHAGLE